MPQWRFRTVSTCSHYSLTNSFRGAAATWTWLSATEAVSLNLFNNFTTALCDTGFVWDQPSRPHRITSVRHYTLTAWNSYNTENLL
jgi:hypothetical protein